jgi:protein TonB
LFSVAPLVLLAGTSQAQFRCDCTSIVDSCSAEVTVSGSSIEVTTDQTQCARVDYFVDGLPFVSVVVDGVERREWIPRTEPPRILVQSCQVCRENTAGAQNPQTSASPPAQTRASAAPAAPDGELEPLISGVPSYPENAGGATGYVELDLLVNAAGRVAEAEITAADPPGTFDQAALAAVQRWRYPAEADREPLTVHERVEFRPPARAAAVQRVDREPPAGVPRNTCVRQSGVYNYGDTVEVGLINACDEPLAVYSCAQGTGRSSGRWVCSDAETRATLLVAGNDPRAGTQTTLEVPSGLRTFTNAGEQLLTRPPNTEYWWVACAAGDTTCREAARQWTRAVDDQPASVDPQTRGRIAVGRSY